MENTQTKMKCTHKDCEHEWNYKGKSKFYVTCPQCYRKVKVQEKGKQ